MSLLHLRIAIIIEICRPGSGRCSRNIRGIATSVWCISIFIIVQSDLSLDDAMVPAEILHWHLKLLNSLVVENNTISSPEASIVASALQTPSK